MAKKGLGIELSTIIITAFGIFAWIAIFTYHSQDPSLFTQSTEPVLNACGQVGASLAALLLQFFGLASFLLPIGFLFVAARTHSSDGLARALSSLAGLSLSVISLTVFLSLHWKSWHWSQTQFLTGGVFGAWLSLPLEHLLNRTGASIASLAVFAGTLVIATPIGVANFLSKFIHAVGVVSYRFSRLLVTYFAYYSAILLNKLAQFIGMQAKKSFDQIKDRAEAYRLAKTEAKAALVHEVSESEVNVKAKAKKATGLTEAALIVSTTADAAAGAVAEEEVVEAKIVEAKIETSKELQVIAPIDSSETSVITISDIKKQVRKQTDFFESGPVIEKAVAIEPDASKSKFKFDKKRGKWKLPIIDFLRKATKVETAIDRTRLTERAGILSDKLAEFGIDGDVTAMRVGPVITLYEFKPGPGIKVSRISGLIEDLSMALASKSVRILAPLPGKAVVGIEIPSENREQVLLREFLQTGEFQNPKYQIPVVMGKDIAGQSILADLSKMPHLLVSGQRGYCK